MFLQGDIRPALYEARPEPQYAELVVHLIHLIHEAAVTAKPDNGFVEVRVRRFGRSGVHLNLVAALQHEPS